MSRPAIYVVTLTAEERSSLQSLISKGKAAAHKQTHARILLKADTSSGSPVWGDEQIAQSLEVGRATVERLRRRFVEKGLQAALERKKRPPARPSVMDGEAEARLVALACSAPPEGRARWTLHLLADRMVELRYVGSVSHETVRRTLKKTSSSLG
jgi:transposase